MPKKLTPFQKAQQALSGKGLADRVAAGENKPRRKPKKKGRTVSAGTQVDVDWWGDEL